MKKLFSKFSSKKLKKNNENKENDQDNEFYNSKYKLIEYDSTIKRDENNKSITFKVCEVEKSPWGIKDKFCIEEFINLENEKTGDDAEQYKVLKTSITDGDGDDLINIGCGSNSFIYSAWESYNNHNHLVLRPDNIWMAILTQLSFYINKNSEELREKFVDFTGKKELIVETDYPILEAPFDEVVIEMSNRIQSNIKDPSIKDLIIPDFTTTTESDKVVFSIALMSTMKKYFDYQCMSSCGLPEVTLLGEINDWINLKERVEKLIQFDNKDCEIKKWLVYLLPVIDKFIDSVNGNPDTTWWNQMVDYKSSSGGSILTGWLATFCVFDIDGKYNDNLILWWSNKDKKYKWPRVNGDSIPNGFISAPIKLIQGEIQYNSTIYSGHFGSKLLDNNSKLIPSLDWFIIAKLL
ncbi:hypothetical protein DDB_G0290823 [Dictyostelium discoideum AX4]|uniref:DUF4419 domain-containing protein n=1 Tax=Dictyostelium discoideum TaxID=44689 RepID=Q54FI5_DICDI|nr:hypothetical protein DDB_G0290823 [Dictyostelium discoideum AX4]EAL62045.1 hypothetical protein DDB_G0290823 [Dictyostelium discoideum AX4]|eukprot:XP_635555.1 hypothetical protein DDB_G0290823 [Dictyostelium discoideum AX4]